MALVQFETLDQAVEALVHMHNFRMSDKMHLRVSFSRSDVHARKAGDSPSTPTADPEDPQ